MRGEKREVKECYEYLHASLPRKVVGSNSFYCGWRLYAGSLIGLLC